MSLSSDSFEESSEFSETFDRGAPVRGLDSETEAEAEEEPDKRARPLLLELVEGGLRLAVDEVALVAEEPASRARPLLELVVGGVNPDIICW
jgi:hypothetical protein